MRRLLRLLLIPLSFAACDGSPVDPTAAEQVDVLRHWRFDSQHIGTGTRAGPWHTKVDGVVSDSRDYGGMVLYPPDRGPNARGEVFSNETGHTYWISTQTPSVELSDTGATIATQTVLQQVHRFRKTAPDATLEFVISGLTLDAIDDNANEPTFGECPWIYSDHDPFECATVLWAILEFDLQVNGPTEGDGPACGSFGEDCFHSVYGMAQLMGWRGTWEHEVRNYGRAVAVLWLPDDFVFDPNVGGQSPGAGGRAQLRLARNVTVPIPLERVPLDSVFEVRIEAIATTTNTRQRESYLSAYFRDPVGGSGLDYHFEGLTPVAVPPSPPREAHAAGTPVCRAGPGAAGTLQFAATAFEGPEPRRGGHVVVSRTGGSSGAVSARLTTSDGTAKAGADYVRTDTYVNFADGEEGERVVLVPFLDDALPEPNETIHLALSGEGGCASVAAPAQATLTILDDDGPPPLTGHTVGGTVSGLVGSGLVLTLNSTNDLPLRSNGAFTWDRRFADRLPYHVRVAAQPTDPDQACIVVNGEGEIAGADVTDIEVTCSTVEGSGHLDAGFGSGGKVATTDLGPARGAALQTDGKLVVVGGDGRTGARLARFLPDGRPDAGFGTGGVVAVEFHGAAFDVLRAVAIQPDGRIVVAGESKDGAASPTYEDWVMARYNHDGTLDTSFGNGGRIVTDFGGRGDGAHQVLIQPDGLIVVTGTASLEVVTDLFVSHFAAVRYLADGTVDRSFGTGGIAKADVAVVVDRGPRRINLGYGAALQPDGKLVIAGRVAASGGEDPDVGIARFTTDGQLDETFGDDGVVRDETGGSGEAAAVIVQPDGRIVVVGHTWGAAPTLLLARYNADGSPDVGFGARGRADATALGAGRAVALQPDGSLVAVGSTHSADFMIARFDAAGRLDPSFGEAGVVGVDFFGGADIAQAVVIQPDGKIVAAGSARNGTANGLGIVRALP